MKKAADLLSGLAFFLFAWAIILSVIDGVCFDRSFYQRAYDEADTAEEIGMSDEDLMAATEVLLDYLQGERDDILYEADVNGYRRDIFSHREELHMQDVRTLYQNAMKVMKMLYLVSAGLIVLAVLMSHQEAMKHIWEGCKYGMILAGLCVGFISLLAAVDFYDFWINFHELFFDNDLYYLDPNTSIMINMFPENFFVQMVGTIILVSVLICLTLCLVIYVFRRKEKKLCSM